MSDMEFEERRTGRNRDIEVLANRQAEWLTKALLPNEAEAAIFCDGLTVKNVSDENLYCVFPARIVDTKTGSGDKFTLFFDIPTVEHLSDTFAESYKVTESELIELYIGTAIAAHLLASRIREQNILRVQRVNNVLTDPNPILEMMRCTDIIPSDNRWNAIQSIMQSQDTRIGNINVLRFAFGMVYLGPESVADLKTAGKGAESRENRTMLLFRDGLVRTMYNRPVYQKMGEFFGRHISPESSTQQNLDSQAGVFLGEQVFADAMGEFELAACYPMQPQELGNILTICKK